MIFEKLSEEVLNAVRATSSGNTCIFDGYSAPVHDGLLSVLIGDDECEGKNTCTMDLSQVDILHVSIKHFSTVPDVSRFPTLEEIMFAVSQCLPSDLKLSIPIDFRPDQSGTVVNIFEVSSPITPRH